MSQEYKRIIISRTDRLGDVVLSLPVFASLKECFPQNHTIALVTDYTADIVRSSPYVDEVITYNPAESIIRTRRKLKSVEADAILVLFPRFNVAVSSFIAGIPIRVGTAFRWYSFLFNRKVREHRKNSLKHEGEYNLTLAESLGCNVKKFNTTLLIKDDASASVNDFLSHNYISKFVIVHPGSGGSAFEWGTDNFRELVRDIANKLGLNVVVTGTESERTLCKKVSEGISNAINGAGRFSLLEFMALSSKADLFISNSTGPLHIAAAVGTPVIGLYPNKKPMTPIRWAPLTERKIILTPKDGSDNLSSISTGEVLESIQELVQREIR